MGEEHRQQSVQCGHLWEKKSVTNGFLYARPHWLHQWDVLDEGGLAWLGCLFLSHINQHLLHLALNKCFLNLNLN